MEPHLSKLGLNLNLITQERYVFEHQNFSHFLFWMRATSVQNVKKFQG